MDSDGDEFPVAAVRRMMIRIFNELKEEVKEDIQQQFNESQENTDKNSKSCRNS
jgi:hypothetical protein